MKSIRKIKDFYATSGTKPFSGLSGKNIKSMPGNISRPTVEQLEKEIKRRTQEREMYKAIWSAVQTLIVFASVAVLISTHLFPVIQAQRTSMTPTLQDSDVLIFITIGEVKRGDIIAFHYNNQILIKRVIATAGEWVNIDENGVVYINEDPLNEPYSTNLSLGDCDLDLPVQVPEKHYFLMGDNRYYSLDSRINAIGTIHSEYIIGKAILRIWPLPRFGSI